MDEDPIHTFQPLRADLPATHPALRGRLVPEDLDQFADADERVFPDNDDEYRRIKKFETHVLSNTEDDTEYDTEVDSVDDSECDSGDTTEYDTKDNSNGDTEKAGDDSTASLTSTVAEVTVSQSHPQVAAADEELLNAEDAIEKADDDNIASPAISIVKVPVTKPQVVDDDEDEIYGLFGIYARDH